MFFRPTKKVRFDFSCFLFAETVTFPVGTVAALQTAKGTKTIRLTPTTMVIHKQRMHTLEACWRFCCFVAKHKSDKYTDPQSKQPNCDHCNTDRSAATNSTEQIYCTADSWSQWLEETSGPTWYRICRGIVRKTYSGCQKMYSVKTIEKNVRLILNSKQHNTD